MERDIKAEKAAYDRLYRRRNAEALAARQRQYYLENREAVKARINAHYHSLSPAERLTRSRGARVRNPDVAIQQRADDYARNRRRYIDKAREWKVANPLRWAHSIALERARKYGATVTLDVATWLALAASYRGACAYCGTVGKQGVDHVVPLCRGGAHSLENVLPACGRCNSSKNMRTPLEWLCSNAPRARLIARQ